MIALRRGIHCIDCIHLSGVKVREDWQGRELELVSYQGRIQLVKGWDAVFSRLEEHLNGLQSMRASPHFHAVQVIYSAARHHTRRRLGSTRPHVLSFPKNRK